MGYNVTDKGYPYPKSQNTMENLEYYNRKIGVFSLVAFQVVGGTYGGW